MLSSGHTRMCWRHQPGMRHGATLGFHAAAHDRRHAPPHRHRPYAGPIHTTDTCLHARSKVNLQNAGRHLSQGPWQKLSNDLQCTVYVLAQCTPKQASTCMHTPRNTYNQKVQRYMYTPRKAYNQEVHRYINKVHKLDSLLLCQLRCTSHDSPHEIAFVRCLMPPKESRQGSAPA